MRDHSQITQEFRLESTSSGPFSWQGGLYFFKEAHGFDSYTYNTLGGNVQSGAVLKTDQSNDAVAVFGSIGYQISPDLKLRAGLRYTNDKKTLNTQPLPPGDPNPSNVANGLGASSDDSNISWDLTGTYKLNKDFNLYARAATGFRGAAIQPAGPFGPLNAAKPETNTSLEVGLKGDLWDKRARTSLSAFTYEVKDQQLTAVGGGSNAVRLVNAKSVVGSGLEATLEAYVTPQLFMTLGGSYNLTKIQDPSLSVGICGACTVLNPINAVG